MEINLQAHRCPTAQVLMNRALEVFIASDAEELAISSIEPSLLRNTEGRIAGLDLPAKVTTVHSRPISQKDIELWQEKYDHDDYGDVKEVVCITIQKTAAALKQAC
jgi:hypothetical protein